MKTLLLIASLFITPLFAEEKDELFITDTGVRIERGYGMTQLYMSYDLENHHTDFQYKAPSCYANKIRKFRPQITQLQKQGYEHTSTNIYKNVVPGTNDKVATFVLTFVMDFLDTDEWMIDETIPEDSDIPRARPADYLKHKYIHFECALKSNENIVDSPRHHYKKAPADTDTGGGKKPLFGTSADK